jgi:hypothetical protein
MGLSHKAWNIAEKKGVKSGSRGTEIEAGRAEVHAAAFRDRVAPQERSFLKEQSWNVIENKGSLWKTWERSWNVYENKAT